MADAHSTDVVPSRRRHSDRWTHWVAVCVLVVLVASDYKLRVRPNDQSIAGNADPFILVEVGLYGLVAGFLLLRFGRPPRVRRVSLPIFVAGVWVVVMVVSATYSLYPMLALIRSVQLFIVFMLVRAIARHGDRGQLHEMAHWFLVLVSGSVILGVLVRLPRFPRQEDRFTWLYLHPVQAGIFVGVATVIAVLYLLAGPAPRPGPHWPRPVYAVLLALVGGGLIGTNTRGAALGAAAGVVVLAFFTTRSGRRKVDVAVISGVAGVAVALASAGAINAFFTRGEDARRLASLNSRTELWLEAFRFIEERPLYGWGMGASRGLFLDTLGLGGGHNAMVNALVDTGIVGAVSWLVLMVTVIVTAARVPAGVAAGRWDRALILGLMAFLAIDSVFTEGPAAAANVASTWLLILVAWVEVLRADVAAAQVAPGPVPAEPPSPVRAIPLKIHHPRRGGLP